MTIEEWNRVVQEVRTRIIKMDDLSDILLDFADNIGGNRP
jgi:hypothetical protein